MLIGTIYSVYFLTLFPRKYLEKQSRSIIDFVRFVGSNISLHFCRFTEKKERISDIERKIQSKVLMIIDK